MTHIERWVLGAALRALDMANHNVETCDRADRETFLRAVALSTALSQACDAIKRDLGE
jgi:hypothetical protein